MHLADAYANGRAVAVAASVPQELRLGSLATVRTAVLPCIAAVGGMLTPMLVYVIAQAHGARARVEGGSRVARTCNAPPMP
eukprot:3556037-Pleurochrysis_carterae.AAC.4